MNKLLVINSFGPMASTLLSSLIEKYSFTNIPVRKLGLHQYLLGLYNLDSGYMEERLKQILEQHSTLGLRGGVSVLDRKNQQPRALVDNNKVNQLIDNINAKDIQDLYFKCCNIYRDAVIYKEIKSHRNWQIELTVDIHRYNHEELYQAYQNNFDEVRMIHLHRPFTGWINALASQAFMHPEIINRVKFFPHMRYNDYALYEQAVAVMPGMHINFDDLFDIPIEVLSSKISSFLGVNPPACNLREESFDLYGKILPYSKAFVRFDDKVEFLSINTQNYFNKLIKKKKINKLPYNFFAWCIYLIEMMKYRLINKNIRTKQ